MTSVARFSTTASAKAEGDLAQSDVVKQVADKLNYDPTDVGTVLNETLSIINETVTKGNKVAFKGMPMMEIFWQFRMACYAGLMCQC